MHNSFATNKINNQLKINKIMVIPENVFSGRGGEGGSTKQNYTHL